MIFHISTWKYLINFNTFFCHSLTSAADAFRINSILKIYVRTVSFLVGVVLYFGM